MAEAAGWTRPTLVRLRDVEWANRLGLSPLDRLIGPTPRFAIGAERPGAQHGHAQPGAGQSGAQS